MRSWITERGRTYHADVQRILRDIAESTARFRRRRIGY